MKRFAKLLIILHVALDMLAVVQVVRSTLTNSAYGSRDDSATDDEEEQHANVHLPWLPHCPSMCRCYRARHELIDIVRSARGQEQLKRRFPALRTVNCSHQNLVRFPEDIPPDVEAMQMDGNMLTGFAFHHGISQAFLPYSSGSLVLLNVSNNLIRNLQGGRLELPSLKTLDLSYNLIEAIKTSNAAFFIPLRNLTTLNLSHNNLNYVHSDVLQLYRLAGLDISGNSLKELDLNLFEQLPALQKLNASRNAINHIVKIITTQRPLVSVASELPGSSANDRRRQAKLQLAVLSAIPVRRGILDVLDLSFNRLDTLGNNTNRPESSSPSMTSSESLSFSPDLFSSLIQTRRIIMSGNPIRQIYTNAFSNLSVLEFIELNDMPNLHLIHDRAFSYLPNLAQVSLRRNKFLQYIYDDAFRLCPLVADLDVAHCSRLINVPSRLMIEHVDRLQQVDITNTVLSCAFNWPWLKEYFNAGDTLFKTKVKADGAEDHLRRAPALLLSAPATNPSLNPAVEPALCRLPNSTLITVRNASSYFASVLKHFVVAKNSLALPQPELIVLGTTSATNATSNETQVAAAFGQGLELTCLYAIMPPQYDGSFHSLPIVKWKRSRTQGDNISLQQLMQTNESSAALHNERRLIINPIMPFDNGLYECEVEFIVNATRNVTATKHVDVTVSMRNISFSAKVSSGASKATLYWNNSNVGLARFFSVLYQPVSDLSEAEPIQDAMWREICANQDVVNFDPRSARGQQCKIGDFNGGGAGTGLDYETEGGKTYNVCLTLSRPSYAEWLNRKATADHIRLHHYISCTIISIAHNTPSSPTLGLATAYEITVVGIALVASLAICVCCARCVCNLYWQHKLDRRMLTASSAASACFSSSTFTAAAGRRPLRHSVSLVMLENSFYSRTPSAPGTPGGFSNAGLEIEGLRDDYDYTSFALPSATNTGGRLYDTDLQQTESNLPRNEKIITSNGLGESKDRESRLVSATEPVAMRTNAGISPPSPKPLSSVFVVLPPTIAKDEEKNA